MHTMHTEQKLGRTHRFKSWKFLQIDLSHLFSQDKLLGFSGFFGFFVGHMGLYIYDSEHGAHV